MKTRKTISTIFGVIIFLCSLILFFSEPEDGANTIDGGIIFLAVSLVLLPTYDYLCMLINKKMSLGKKIGLGVGTLLIPTYLSSTEQSAGSTTLVIASIIIFWIVMFVTTKDEYVLNDSKVILEEKDKKGFFNNIYNKRVQRHNEKAQEIIKNESGIKKQFRDLDVTSNHSIAKMISETRVKTKTMYLEDMPILDLSELVLSFCKDTQYCESEIDFNNCFTTQYYISKANKECSKLTDYIKNKIKMSLGQNKSNYMMLYNDYLTQVFDRFEMFNKIKLGKSVTAGQEEELAKYSNYGIPSTISPLYREALIYLFDVIATCSSIARLLFIEKKVSNLNKDGEFYKILKNMSKEISDYETIVKKTRPIYDEFYKSELGYIEDEINYNLAITIIVNRINNKDFSKKDEEILDINKDKALNMEEYENIMMPWIRHVADKYRNLDIIKYIVYKTIHTIDLDDFKLYFESLSRIFDYSRIYYYNVEHNNKATDKDRYLSGDFEKEKKELSGKYSLNNITTGTQFELYLVNLFKDLGYKVKHNGKSGDQGCDLIVKKDDYVYAIQAKYYTGNLGNSPVQEIASALKYYNANQGVVITNSSFTPGAKELAKANNVILIDGKGLKKLVNFVFEESNEDDVLKKFDK